MQPSPARYSLEKRLRVEKLTLFETPQRFYLVGSCGPEDRDVFYVARVDRSDIHTVSLMEEDYRYTREEVEQSMRDVGAKVIPCCLVAGENSTAHPLLSLSFLSFPLSCAETASPPHSRMRLPLCSVYAREWVCWASCGFCKAGT